MSEFDSIIEHALIYTDLPNESADHFYFAFPLGGAGITISGMGEHADSLEEAKQKVQVRLARGVKTGDYSALSDEELAELHSTKKEAETEESQEA